jgi:hypothetical protein
MVETPITPKTTWRQRRAANVARREAQNAAWRRAREDRATKRRQAEHIAAYYKARRPRKHWFLWIAGAVVAIPVLWLLYALIETLATLPPGFGNGTFH